MVLIFKNQKPREPIEGLNPVIWAFLIVDAVIILIYLI